MIMINSLGSYHLPILQREAVTPNIARSPSSFPQGSPSHSNSGLVHSRQWVGGIADHAGQIVIAYANPWSDPYSQLT